MDATVKTVEERATGSHDSRRVFQSLAYNIALFVVLAFCVILLFGIAFPPPALNTNVSDWGATIVARANQAWTPLLAALGALGGWIGMTLTRGAHDASLEIGKKDGAA